MDDFKINISADLDTWEAEQKLDKLTNEKYKVHLDIDDSELDAVSKKADKINNKDVNIDAKVSGAKNVDNLSGSFKNASKSASEFGNTVKGFAKLSAYINTFQLIEQGAKAAAKYIKQVDDAYVDLQNATGMGYTEVRNLVSGYNDLGKIMGATTTEVSSGADAWLRQGKNLAETNSLLKDSMVLAKVGNLETADSTEYLTSAMKGYKVAVEDVSKINDKLTSVDMVSATDAGGLAEGMSRTAVMASGAGVEMERLLGYLAVVGETTQKSMTSVGESFKTIFSRMQDIKANKLELIDEDGTTELLSDVELTLANVGISLRETVNEYNDAGEVLDALAGKWDSLSSVQQSAISKAFAGIRQSENFRVLMENYDNAMSYMNTAMNSEGTALRKFEDNYLNSIEAKSKSLQASFESLSVNAVSRDTITGIMDATTALVTFVDKSNLAKGAITGLTVAGGIKTFTMLATSIFQATVKMNQFNSALKILKAGNIGTEEMERLVAMTSNLSNSQLKAVISSKALSTEQRIAILTAHGMSDSEAKATLSTLGLSTAQGTATATTVTLSGALKGLWATLMANPLVLIVTAITAGVMAFSKLKDMAYEAGYTFEGAQAIAKESAEAYKATASELESLNSELETTKQRIDELQSQDSLTLAEEQELEKLQTQNELLEKQIALKERALDAQGKQSAKDAKKSIDYKSETGYQYQYDASGNVISAEEVSIDRVEYVKQQLDKMEQTKELLKQNEEKLLNETLSDDETKSLEQAIANQKATLEEYESEVSRIISELSDESQAFYDINGQIVEGFEADALAVEQVIDLYNTFDLSETEKNLKAIEDYFDGSNKKNLIKDKLMDVAESSDDAKDITKALEAMGVNLEEAGLDADTLNRYFKDMADSANDASDAVENINNNLTMEDIDHAFETKNAGDDYVSLNDYLNKANELYKQGLVGTDEFKAVAEMISYNVDSSTESFKKNYDSLQSFFIEDGDGNLTAQGIHNFLTELEGLNKGYAEFDGTTNKWNLNMENTAQAAKDMNMSVAVFEALLGRIQDYDNLGEFEFVSALAEFKEVQGALSGLESIFDELSDSDYKDSLGEKLEKWSPLIEQAENDLASLPREVVTELKFEYDVAMLQKMIDELDRQWEQGDRSAETGASRNVARENLRETREEQTGYNEATDTGYAQSYKAIADLQLEFNEDGADVEAIQNKISSVLDLQTAFQNALANNETVDWDAFLQSRKAQEIFDSITESGIATREEIATMLGVDVEDIEFDITANDEASNNIDRINESEIKDKIVKLIGEDDATPYIQLWNDLSASDKFASLTAEDQATQVIALWNSMTPEQKEAYLNGEITVIDNASDVAQSATNAINANPLSPHTNITATDGTRFAVQNATIALNSLDGKTVHTYIVTHHSNIGGSNLAGTAHMNGTTGLYGRAYLNGNMSDTSWIKDRWKTSKGEVALTGEEGQEMVVDKNDWWTVGDKGAEFTNIPKGAVVFNAEQTKKLLTRGYIHSRGKALLNGTTHLKGRAFKSGTAYLGSSTGGFSFSGGASSYSSTSSKVSGSNSGLSETSKDAEDTAEKIDWIETNLERVQRAISNMDKVASATFKSWTERNKALADEIAQVNTEISLQQKAYERYLAETKTVGLDPEYQKLVMDGAIDIESISDETLREQIEEFQKWYNKALSCSDAIIDLKQDLADLAQMGFENTLQEYEDKLAGIEHNMNMINSSIERVEEQGYVISAKYYNELIKQQEDYISTLQQEYTALTQSLANAMAIGDIDVGDEAYNEMIEEIYDVKKALADANTELVEFQNQIDQLKFDSFERLHELISKITTESEFLVDMMSDANKFDTDTGAITDQGMVTLGLHAVDYNVAKAQAEEYAKMIADLDEKLKLNPFNEDLRKQRDEYWEKMLDYQSQSKGAYDSMIDIVSEGFDVFLDKAKELADKSKDRLRNVKDLYDYEKSIKEQTDEIAVLEKRLEAYSGDSSEENRVRIQETKEQLEKARENLEETQYEQYIRDSEQLIDQYLLDVEEWISLRLQNTDELIAGVIGAVNDNSGQIYETLQSEAEKMGYDLSEEMESIWNTSDGSYGKVVSEYYGGFETQLTTVNQTLSVIKGFVADMLKDADEKAEESIDEQKEIPNVQDNNTVNADKSTSTSQSSQVQSETVPKTETQNIEIGSTINAGNAKIYGYAGDTSGEKQYFSNDPVYKVLDEKDGYIQVRWHKAKSGVTGWFKKSDIKGYNNGGWIDETGLFIGHGSKSKPEAVLDAEDSKNLINLTDFLKDFDSGNFVAKGVVNNPLVSQMYQIPKGGSNVNVYYNTNFGDIQMFGVNDKEEFAKEVRSVIINDIPTGKAIWDVSVGRARGNNSLNRYRNY